MLHKQKCIVLDIDGTLCPKKAKNESYADLLPFPEMMEQLARYREQGFYVILYTARNMNTYDGNVGRIVANTGKLLMEWLEKHQVPYDELHLGKPWPGRGGFYVDDKAIRPDEFLKLSYSEILELVGDEPGGE
ncbi:capsular biosynthesis protein [Caballeronia sp. LZ062]|uniref:capsular biosynthesis protein n=1 Tax=unclassified Caballeronia TaxID=2646786 RepID=UPI002862D981|nr:MULTISPECIES: capsular biosynthesis protein [unclassified Caballeronia]MDR5855198.1 capsular biosynthesis protein [Caballeronia sp. LZ050]MDR5870272.1 capsular biosynthesis protein [Caballeronia sp. LZ062]